MAGEQRGDPVETPQRPFCQGEAVQEGEYIDRRDRRQCRWNECADDFTCDGRLHEATQPRIGFRISHAHNMLTQTYLNNRRFA